MFLCVAHVDFCDVYVNLCSRTCIYTLGFCCCVRTYPGHCRHYQAQAKISSPALHSKAIRHSSSGSALLVKPVVAVMCDYRIVLSMADCCTPHVCLHHIVIPSTMCACHVCAEFVWQDALHVCHVCALSLCLSGIGR